MSQYEGNQNAQTTPSQTNSWGQQSNWPASSNSWNTSWQYEGYGNQSYQNQGYQAQGYQTQGYQNQGYQNQNYQNQGYYSGFQHPNSQPLSDASWGSNQNSSQMKPQLSTSNASQWSNQNSETFTSFKEPAAPVKRKPEADSLDDEEAVLKRANEIMQKRGQRPSYGAENPYPEPKMPRMDYYGRDKHHWYRGDGDPGNSFSNRGRQHSYGSGPDPMAFRDTPPMGRWGDFSFPNRGGYFSPPNRPGDPFFGGGGRPFFGRGRRRGGRFEMDFSPRERRQDLRRRQLYVRFQKGIYDIHKLKSHFGQWGKIIGVTMQEKDPDSSMETAVIVFKNERAVDKAFDKSNRELSGSSMEISRSFSRGKGKPQGKARGKRGGQGWAHLDVDMTHMTARQRNRIMSSCKARLHPRDPHNLCTFCRIKNTGKSNPCLTKSDCKLCTGLSKHLRRNLLANPFKMARHQRQHPCYFNCFAVDSHLGPRNITGYRFSCSLCAYTVRDWRTNWYSHNHSKSHVSFAITRKIMRKNRLNTLYHEYMSFVQTQDESNPKVFCNECFLVYQIKGIQKHGRSHTLHKMFIESRMMRCDICDVNVANLEKHIEHCYDEEHLNEVVHKSVTENKAGALKTESEDSEGMPKTTTCLMMTITRPTLKCFPCQVYLSAEAVEEHCKTLEHFEKSKQFVVDRALKAKELEEIKAKKAAEVKAKKEAKAEAKRKREEEAQAEKEEEEEEEVEEEEAESHEAMGVDKIESAEEKEKREAEEKTEELMREQEEEMEQLLREDDEENGVI